MPNSLRHFSLLMNLHSHVNVPISRSEGLCLHLLAQLNIELSRPQEPQQSQSVESFLVSRLLEHSSQLMDLGILFFGGMAGVAGLSLGSSGWEVVVIVLGVEVHVRVLCRGPGGLFGGASVFF